MAVDAGEVAGQVEAPASSEVAAEQGAPSGAEGQEQGGIGGWFRRFLGGGTPDAAEEPVSGADQEAEPGEATTPTSGREETVEQKAQRLAQSIADQEIAKREWTRAVSAADRGDTSLLREMAERGHGPAQRELAKRGETFELGEARAKELRDQEAHEGTGQTLAGIAQVFDTATIKPLLDALPAAAKDDALDAFKKAGGGIDGREALVTTALKVYAKSIREASDDDVLKRIDEDDVFRKKVMAKLRGLEDFEEPDLIGAVSSSGREDADAFVRSLFNKG